MSFPIVVGERKLSKKLKKGCAKGAVAMLKESFPFGCVSQECYPRESVPLEQGKLGPKHAVKSSKGTWHQVKIRDRTSSSRGIVCAS